MEDENFEKAKEDIKELYKDLISTAEMNPNLYIMPVELYNIIMKKLAHLERELGRARKSRDILKDKLKELK